jgi:hypothetical protein
MIKIKYKKMAAKSEILAAAGLVEPEQKMIIVKVRIKRIKHGDTEFFNIKGTYAESTKVFNANISVDRAKYFNFSEFEGDKEHILRIILENKKAGITGYVKGEVATAHESTGWSPAEVLGTIQEDAPEYKTLVAPNKALTLFTTAMNKAYSPEIEQDRIIYNQYLQMAMI